MKKIVSSLLVVSSLFIASCSNDDDNSSSNNDDSSTTVEAPETYVFSRDGESTVSFSGQTTRIAMAQEITDALKDSDFTEASINQMFTEGTGFADVTLDTEDKQVRSKVAASEDYFSSNTVEATEIKEYFDAIITEQVNDVFPNFNSEASAGVAGGLVQESGDIRYINSQGVELNQLFAKGLIGGLMADQILNNYLSVDVLDEGTNEADNDAGILVDGETYTNMEHKWDEAYGYLYGAELDEALPVLEADSFLNNYLADVDADTDFSGVANDIFTAFKLGRAAIVAGDYDLRDEQAEIIREKISLVVAVRGVFYLQDGKNKLETDKASAFHGLSEGLGFVYSLQFTRKANEVAPYFTKDQVDGFLSDLLDEGNGLWDDTTAVTLDEISEEIAGVLGFAVEEAAPSE